MTEDYIRAFNSRLIIGIIRTLDNGDKEAIDFDTRKILGWYRKSRDVTTDFLGRMIAKGDCVTALIWNNKHDRR
jgi:hypothetical protein